jgi:dihydroneopterin aldolase
MRYVGGGQYDAFMQADRIEITGIAASGVHGVYEDEDVDAQPFVVDVLIWTNVSEAATSDRLESTIDYVAASELVQQVVESSRAKLIETLANEICEALLSNIHALAVQITVHKPRAARDARADDVSITLMRTR